MWDFNPRSHKGNDRLWVHRIVMRINFNPRSHKGNDRLEVMAPEQMLVFQSTFPQGERPLTAPTFFDSVRISIHVPTRGTTIEVFVFRFYLCDFNPRSHKGNDVQAISGVSGDDLISIHVPTRGTTFLLFTVAQGF